MNTKSFNAGYKALNATVDAANVAVDAVKYIPNAFCDLGNSVRNDMNEVAGTITSFFAGMRHASRVRSGRCALLRNEVRSNEETSA